MASLLLAALLLAAGPVRAGEPDDGLQALIAAFDVARFESPRWERVAALRAVAADAAMLATRHPDATGPLVVRGAALTELAIGAGGAAGADDAGEARAVLKEALARDPAALHGAAHTSLGLLYHKMPSGPLGVGSPRRAERQFRHALAVDPQGVEPNYRYADFLADQDRPEEARRHAGLALAAAPGGTGRPVADAALAAAARELVAELGPGD